MDAQQIKTELKTGAVLVVLLLWYAFLGLLVSRLFSSCTTAHKASRYMVKHPVVGATYCTVYHPCKDSVSLITKYMEGELRIDTIDNSHVDSFISERTNTRTIIKYRTVVKIKTDTVTSIRTIYQTDKGANLLLQNAKEQIITKDRQLHKRTRVAFWLGMSWLLFILGILVRALWFNRVNRG